MASQVATRVAGGLGLSAGSKSWVRARYRRTAAVGARRWFPGDSLAAAAMQAQSGRASLTKPGSGTTMNAPNTRASSGNLQQQQLTGLQGNLQLRCKPHAQGRAHDQGRAHAHWAAHTPGESSTQYAAACSRKGAACSLKAAPGKQQQVTQSAGEKATIQKRVEEQAKVPFKFRDSFKQFFFLPTGVLKILRLGLIIGALVCFITAKAHELYIAITVLEMCIVLFFIIIYILDIHHLLICLDWSLLDLINSFITAVFLLIVAILVMQEMERRHLFYVGGLS